MSVLAADGVAVNLVLLEQIEQRLVTAKADGSELVIVPLFAEDVLDVAILVAAEGNAVHVGAVLAKENTQPHNAVGSRVLFAIKTVFVVWDCELIFKELFDLSRLRSSAGFEESDFRLMLDRFGFGLLVFLRREIG
jgi:hypothetical protein